MSDYRTPKLEEFVDGFEYEFLTQTHTFTFVPVDMEDDVDSKELEKTIAVDRPTYHGSWVKQKFVRNRHFPSVQIHDIIDFIKKGRIRCQNTHHPD